MKQFKYFCPTLSECWQLVAVLISGMLLAGLVLGIVWHNAPQAVSYGLGMLPPLLFAYGRGRRRARSGAAPCPLESPDLGGTGIAVYAVLLFVALISVSVATDPATGFIPMPDRIRMVFEQAFLNSKTADMVIATCIMAPLCEELLCRGLIMRGLLANGKSPRSAILWSAFIFALIHMNPWQSIPAFAFGLFFGWVYWRTGSLWSTIALHAANNGISAAIARIWPEIGVDTGLVDILPTGLYIAVYVASLALLFAAISLLNRKLPEKCTKNSTL